VAAGVMLGEFSNVGSFVGSHDVVLVSETYLQKELTWTEICLLIFLLGFLIEEFHDFYCAFRSSSVEERDDAKKACGPGASIYLYLSSVWNIMDVLMIVSGFTYLFVLHHAAQALDKYTLQEVWLVASEIQVAEVFGAITAIFAFFRILDYLALWEFVGVLIISIFKMMTDIVRFLFIFILVVIGFSAGFHLSYTGNVVDTWNNFVSGVVTTFLTSPTGYEIPGYGNNILGLAGPAFGFICQIIYVFIGIILLLNLLIALLWETYAISRSKATVEFRWHVSLPFKTGYSVLWPSPFTTLHIFLMTCMEFLLAVGKWFGGRKVNKKYGWYKETREALRPGLPTNYELLMRGMVVHYFKTSLADQYKNYLVQDNNVFTNQDPFSSKGKEHF